MRRMNQRQQQWGRYEMIISLITAAVYERRSMPKIRVTPHCAKMAKAHGSAASAYDGAAQIPIWWWWMITSCTVKLVNTLRIKNQVLTIVLPFLLYLRKSWALLVRKRSANIYLTCINSWRGMASVYQTTEAMSHNALCKHRCTAAQSRDRQSNCP